MAVHPGGRVQRIVACHVSGCVESSELWDTPQGHRSWKVRQLWGEQKDLCDKEIMRKLILYAKI